MLLYYLLYIEKLFNILYNKHVSNQIETTKQIDGWTLSKYNVVTVHCSNTNWYIYGFWLEGFKLISTVCVCNLVWCN